MRLRPGLGFRARPRLRPAAAPPWPSFDLEYIYTI
jgi:hypothetical protein